MRLSVFPEGPSSSLTFTFTFTVMCVFFSFNFAPSLVQRAVRKPRMRDW